MAKKATPSPVPQATKTPAPPPADDLLSEMLEGVKAVNKEKAKASKADTIVLDDPEDQQKLDEYCATNMVADKANGLADAAKANLIPVLSREVYTRWIQAGSRQDNPKFQSRHSMASFVVENSFRIKVDVDDQGRPTSTILDRFKSVGLPHTVAESVAGLFQQKLVVDSISVTDLQKKDRGLANKFLKLLKGLTAEEVEKIQSLLNENGDEELAEKVNNVCGLTPEERKIVFIPTYEVTPVGDEKPINVINKIVGLAHDDEMMAVILNVLGVTVKVTQTKFNGDQSAFAGSMMERENPDDATEFLTPDEEYKATFEGKVAKLYVAASNTLVGQKDCTSATHAKNTAKKMARDPLYLKQVLVEFGHKPKKK